MFRPHIPSMSEIMHVEASRGQNSLAPNEWNGLVSAFPAQEGGGPTVRDIGNAKKPATLTNMDPATEWVEAENGAALYHPNSADRVIAAGTTATYNFIHETAVFTVMMWVNRLSVAVGTYFWGNNNVSSLEIGMWLQAIGAFRCRCYANVTARWDVTSSVSPSVNQWYHFAVRGTGSSIELYIDGKYNAVDSTITLGTGNASHNLVIGERVTTSGNPLTGYWNDCRIYDRTLSPEEIQSIYEKPFAYCTAQPTRHRVAVVAAPAGRIMGSLVGEGGLVGPSGLIGEGGGIAS